MNIYVATSWRNKRQPQVVQALRADGHQVYDFRNPVAGDAGFSWREIHPDWEHWSTAQYIEALQHPAARRGFGFDMEALRKCDACVLVLPCGRSAHLELGWATGAGRRTIVLLDDGPAEPELMYLMNSEICLSLNAVKMSLRAER